MEAGLQKDINALVGKLRKIDGVLTRDIKKDLRTAATPINAAIKAAAPVGKREHKRYRGGQVVATYKPGNLRKSFRILALRRTRRAVYIGPYSRGANPDGYYARFLEFGTSKMAARPFIENPVLATYQTAQKTLIILLKQRIAAYEKQNSV